MRHIAFNVTPENNQLNIGKENEIVTMKPGLYTAKELAAEIIRLQKPEIDPEIIIESKDTRES